MLVACLVGLVCAFVGSIPIAGPVAVLVVERGLHGHGREGFLVGAGCAIAEAGYALLAFLGMTAALSQFPWMLPASRILGAVILTALGVYFAVARRPPPEGTEAERRWGGGHGQLFLGFIVTAVNPTLLATWSAVVTVLHAAGFVRVNPLDAFPFALGVCVGVAGWFAVLVALLHRFSRKLGRQTLQKIVKAIGWVLVVCGVALMIHVIVTWR